MMVQLPCRLWTPGGDKPTPTGSTCETAAGLPKFQVRNCIPSIAQGPSQLQPLWGVVDSRSDTNSKSEGQHLHTTFCYSAYLEE